MYILQSLVCNKIAFAMRFILEIVIIVQIIPLFATRWKHGHAHFWLLFREKSCKMHFPIESYHSLKKKSVA